MCSLWLQRFSVDEGVLFAHQTHVRICVAAFTTSDFVTECFAEHNNGLEQSLYCYEYPKKFTQDLTNILFWSIMQAQVCSIKHDVRGKTFPHLEHWNMR